MTFVNFHCDNNRFVEIQEIVQKYRNDGLVKMESDLSISILTIYTQPRFGMNDNTFYLFQFGLNLNRVRIAENWTKQHFSSPSEVDSLNELLVKTMQNIYRAPAK